jgi:hypothetical protein
MRSPLTNLWPLLLCTAQAACGGAEAPWQPSPGAGGNAGAAGSADGGGPGGADGGAGADSSAGAAGGTHDGAADGAQEASGCTVQGVPGDCIEVTACAALDNHANTPGLCSGPAELQCCTPFGLALCDPAVLQHPNADNTLEALGQGGCPAGMVRVDAFCIDRFEASLVKVSDGTSWSPYLNPGTTAVRAVSVQGSVPQGYINGTQAASACSQAGKRLCTDAEWLRACQGADGFTFPYGGDLLPGVCNDQRSSHPAVQYFGSTESWIFSKLDNACLNQLPQSLATTGQYAGCVTSEGAFDMVGNLHEWTADPAGTFRGGFYVDTVLNGPGCLYATKAHDTSHWDYSTGFRCCAD